MHVSLLKKLKKEHHGSRSTSYSEKSPTIERGKYRILDIRVYQKALLCILDYDYFCFPD